MKAQVMKSFGVGVGQMLTVSKMTHASSNPAEKPKILPDQITTKRGAKVKAKVNVLKEKAEVVSSNTPTSKQV